MISWNSHNAGKWGGDDKKFPSLEKKPNPHNRKLPLRPCSQQITTWLLKAGILSPTNVAHKALKAGDSLSIPLPLPWHSCGFFTHSRHPRNICAPTPNLLVHGNTSYSCRLVSGRDPRGSMLFFFGGNVGGHCGGRATPSNAPPGPAARPLWYNCQGPVQGSLVRDPRLHWEVTERACVGVRGKA